MNCDDIYRDAMTWSLLVPNLALGEKTTLHDLNVKARLLDRQLTVEKATLPVFGGTIEVLPITVDITHRPIELIAGVNNVDLSKLLDSVNNPALSGSGTLSGKLPLRLDTDTIAVEGGTLEGSRPGTLRFQGPVTDQENIASKALRNLVYHSLKAELDYPPSGDYELGLHLKGRNPDLLEGHPLAFNLNLSGQLPELLQKGILNGDIEHPILEEAIKGPKSVSPIK